jgi:hypothetical protein
MDRRSWICDRLRDIGYAKGRRMRLYGKDLHLISNPMADNEGYIVETVEHKSGAIRRTRIPLMVARVVEKEVAANEDLLVA